MVGQVPLYEKMLILLSTSCSYVWLFIWFFFQFYTFYFQHWIQKRKYVFKCCSTFILNIITRNKSSLLLINIFVVRIVIRTMVLYGIVSFSEKTMRKDYAFKECYTPFTLPCSPVYSNRFTWMQAYLQNCSILMK